MAYSKSKIYSQLFFLFLILIIGCSGVEISRIVGVGVRPFKEQDKIYTQTFDKNFFSCYNKTLRILKKMEAKIHRGSRKKNFIIAANFSAPHSQWSQSTEVAIFFKDLEPRKTQVEVSSLNSSLAEFIAGKLFEDLNKGEVTQPEEEVKEPKEEVTQPQEEVKEPVVSK